MTTPIKIVIIGDSLALPRPREAGLVRYEETYPVLLQRSLQHDPSDREFLVAERGQRFRTMMDCLRDWTEVVSYRAPQVVVVHCGIVDCAPRVFTASERQWLEQLRPRRLQRLILAIVSRLRPMLVRMRGNRVYAPLDAFEESCRQLVARAQQEGVRQLLFLSILRPTAELEARSPGYGANQVAYNRALVRACSGSDAQLLDLDGSFSQAGGTAALTVDGMHPNAAGHRLIASLLKDAITTALERDPAYA